MLLSRVRSRGKKPEKSKWKTRCTGRESHLRLLLFSTMTVAARAAAGHWCFYVSVTDDHFFHPSLAPKSVDVGVSSLSQEVLRGVKHLALGHRAGNVWRVQRQVCLPPAHGHTPSTGHTETSNGVESTISLHSRNNSVRLVSFSPFYTETHQASERPEDMAKATARRAEVGGSEGGREGEFATGCQALACPCCTVIPWGHIGPDNLGSEATLAFHLIRQAWNSRVFSRLQGFRRWWGDFSLSVLICYFFSSEHPFPTQLLHVWLQLLSQTDAISS